MLLRTEHLFKSYQTLTVLNDVSIAVQKGEIVSITGPSGAGKSTLLHLAGTLDKPTSGKVFIQDKEVSTLSEKELSRFRNLSLGFIFQFHHLLPEFTALENVCIPAFIANKEKHLAEKRAKELLDMLKLSHRLHHKPAAMSGGEQQRVAVARALINDPLMIMADEPSGNLDSAHARELHELFFQLRNDLNQTFIIVTHNDELAKMADRTISMKDGKIV